MTCRSATKTVSWAIVSFFVIYVAEMAVIAWRDGAAVAALVAPAAALGVAVSCVVKSPVYLVHDHAWDRWFFGREIAEIRRLEASYNRECFADVQEFCPCDRCSTEG